ncbi:hypothetical protein AYO21_11451 [Fonsecaea monophora]|uniref:Uncharacterized protein n=2 Tax=Fonsecaea TaxID=40354 RepID=A0A0D2DDJ7_9EURO|nr:uncharacterized protein Z517_10494 [Fonsecaea pedrosoi CBS 271.37]XP_022506345.1 hypothetical protein AYO21_11451 [Fonsecaea monophora]KAH0846639.1 hypothetical protein FOPE_12594 [Fonsecaea pedrosoi]KIW75751.1 hypothetical protein Z517_10494 [Fonsecaea pedrosoi CBS 271.37]OAG34393.1 hypothetical protein AYO21_11451 [Fonsecaea monophora]
MAYILYSILFFSIALSTILYFTRSRWTPYLPIPVQDLLSRLNPYTYSRVPTTFMGDVESGFTSADFDLSSNIMEGDSRGGLDQRAKREIQRLMKIRGINFDEARRVYMEQRFKKNGIGEDGIPKDPKFVSFS